MLLADMLLRTWLDEQGITSLARASLAEVEYFAFGEDAYYVRMRAGNTFQDNDLERMLSVIKDEFVAVNTTVLLRQHGHMFIPSVSYEAPLQRVGLAPRRNTELRITAKEGGRGGFETFDIETFIDNVRQCVTVFNVSGEWTNFRRPNL